MSLFEQPLAIVDLETTGGDPRVDRVTEIGVVLIDGVIRREWSSLVNPDVSIPANIQRFIGITDAMVADAPRFADLAGELAALLQGRLFIAHNARFDHGFLRNEFARLGVSFSPQVMCSVKLSRALYPGFPRHGLDALMERFGLGCDARHRALGDARVVRDFLDIVVRDFDPLRIEQAMQKAGRTSAAPPGMMPGALDDIPDAPGVYMFYGDPPPATDLVPAGVRAAAVCRQEPQSARACAVSFLRRAQGWAGGTHAARHQTRRLGGNRRRTGCIAARSETAEAAAAGVQQAVASGGPGGGAGAAGWARE
jgi:DNA polymerase-3 subunit epsilon